MKHNKKRLAALLLALALSLGLTACGGTPSSSPAPTGSAPVQEIGRAHV